MSEQLLEAMVGHRTRLVQQPQEEWHRQEDEALDRFIAKGDVMDRASLWLTLVPRGWLVLALAALIPALARTHHCGIARRLNRWDPPRVSCTATSGRRVFEPSRGDHFRAFGGGACGRGEPARASRPAGGAHAFARRRQPRSTAWSPRHEISRSATARKGSRFSTTAV